MTEKEKSFGEEKIPKCQYCPNKLDEGMVENFSVIWISTNIGKPDVLAGGDICVPCCQKKLRELRELLECKPE